MLERLRQIAFMVRDLEEGRELYRRTLGMEACHSEDLSQFGLENLVFPAGNGTFVELLHPTAENSPGGRFLERRGEAPYLLIFETKQYDQLIPHLKSLGVRISSEMEECDVMMTGPQGERYVGGKAVVALPSKADKGSGT